MPLSNKAQNAKRLKRKEELIKLAGGRCMDCHTVYPTYVYDFHHRTPDDKLFTIGGTNLLKNFDSIKEEAKKCDLLCSNCHRIRHYKNDYKQTDN